MTQLTKIELVDKENIVQAIRPIIQLTLTSLPNNGPWLSMLDVLTIQAI